MASGTLLSFQRSIPGACLHLHFGHVESILSTDYCRVRHRESSNLALAVSAPTLALCVGWRSIYGTNFQHLQAGVR
jgi:hypothetical protein